MEKDLLNSEKQLLLIDLSARLPYGVKVQYEDNIFDIDYISPMYEEVKLNIADNYTIGVDEIKPYLFPLSSMTEEQREEYHSFFVQSQRDFITPNNAVKLFDWLFKNHFDYRGLIEKGLAIDCTNLNIY